tara:strand:- start:170 stop:373 length:204 start_codon:yes stop_codon:yes gene_type:complete
MRNQDFKVQGFLKGKREIEKSTVNSSGLEHVFNGLKLDEIQLQATIKSKKDVENLILFLQESKPCFM